MFLWVAIPDNRHTRHLLKTQMGAKSSPRHKSAKEIFIREIKNCGSCVVRYETYLVQSSFLQLLERSVRSEHLGTAVCFKVFLHQVALKTDSEVSNTPAIKSPLSLCTHKHI